MSGDAVEGRAAGASDSPGSSAADEMTDQEAQDILAGLATEAALDEMTTAQQFRRYLEDARSDQVQRYW